MSGLFLLFYYLQGSFLEVSHNWSRSEPGAEDVVHGILDLSTDHQVIDLKFKNHYRIELLDKDHFMWVHHSRVI